MIKSKTKGSDNIQSCASASCCNVDALISIDGRGQLVLPKDVRDKAEISAGDKFAVITCESNGKVGFIALIKANALSETVKGMLGPLVQ
jgi:AbrB family looped-hinge helix DNA binding protein